MEEVRCEKEPDLTAMKALKQKLAEEKERIGRMSWTQLYVDVKNRLNASIISAAHFKRYRYVDLLNHTY